MNEETEPKNRLWFVQMTLPKDESKGRRWAINKRVGIASMTIERAIEKARIEYPDAVFWQVTHQGPLHIE